MSIAVVILAATTGIYYDVLKNNVDFEKSFNDDLMVAFPGLIWYSFEELKSIKCYSCI